MEIGAAAPDGDPPLVRRDELAALRRLAAAARDGQPRTVFITGPAGSGKSALVAEFLGDLGDGAFVLSGSCPPVIGVELPLAGLVQALRSLNRQLAPDEVARVLGPARDVIGRLSPALAGDAKPSSEPLSLGVLFEHVLGVLERLAEGRRLLVLVLDGLQWGGPTTWSLVAHLAMNLVGSPIMIVLTMRSDELPAGGTEEHLLVELQRRAAVESVDLLPLDGAQSQELLSSWMTDASTEERRRIAVAAGGNPLLLRELATAAAGGASEIPASVREIVLDRMASLSEGSVGLVRLAAVASRSATAELLIRASGLDEPSAIAGLREAVRAAVLRAPRDDATAFVFSQEVFRQVVYEDLVAGERAGLHGLVARVLSAAALSSSADVAMSVELAGHWRASGDAARALPALLRAADAAERGYAFPEAHRLFEEALAIVDAAPTARSRRPLGFQLTETTPQSEWADLRSRAAEVASLAGESDRAVDHIDAALEGRLEPRWQERRARYLLESGKSDESLRAYDRLVATSADDAMPRTLVAYARALSSAGRHDQAEDVAERALASARTHGARTEEWLALVVVGVARAHRGDLKGSLTYLADARRIAADRPSDTMIRPRPTRIGEILGGQLAASRALEWIGRPEDAESWRTDVGRDADRLGATRWAVELDVVSARQAYRAGAWDEGIERAARVIEAGGAQAIEARVVRSRIEVGRGEWEAAASDLAAVRPSIESERRVDVVADYYLASGEAALWQRRLSEGAEVVNQGIATLSGTEDRLGASELGLLAVRIAVEQFEEAKLRRVSPEIVERREQVRRHAAEVRVSAPATPRGETIVRLAEAEATRVDVSDVAAWHAAARSAEAAREPYPTAYARWCLADALLSVGESRTEAAASLRLADEGAAGLRAGPLVAAIRRLAARARIEIDLPVPAPPEGSPSVDPGQQLGLSEREVEVLLLVALGRTNRQIADELFITEKTAGHHVSNILGKLGVANRMEAAAVAHRAGLTSSE